MNHYPRHVGDFIKDTVGLSLAERGAYTALLDQYYASEKPIQHAERYRLAGAVSKSDRAAVDYIIGRYFTEQPDGWHQKRADTEIAKYRERSASASASANARWSERNANAMRTHSESNASQKPVTSNQEPVKARAARVRAPATRIGPDWTMPTDWLAWAERQRVDWTDADLHRHADVFADHWRSKGEARSDWGATWRNWVRRERATKVNGTPHDARMDVADQIFKRGKYASGGTARDITSTAERVD